jgi:ribose 5-phosphate isomerase B
LNAFEDNMQEDAKSNPEGKEVDMKIAIGSDKSGYSLKEAIKAYLADQNILFDDLGTTDLNEVHPYYRVAADIAPRVQSGEYGLAILVCGTGAGMSIVANKFKGIFAVACEGVYSAKMARAINNANILCMGGWIVAPEMGVKMAEAFLKTQYLEGLEDWRKDWLRNAADKVAELEDTLYGQ